MSKEVITGIGIGASALDGWGASSKKHSWGGLITETITERGKYNSFHNLGIPGDTSEGILNRFEEVERRLFRNPERETRILILHVPGQDLDHNNDEDRFRCSPVDFCKNIYTILRKSVALFDSVLVHEILPVSDELKPSKDGWLKENQYVDLFNLKLAEACNQFTSKIELVPMNALFRGKEKELLDSDGIHPNDKGHAAIFHRGFQPRLQQVISTFANAS